MFYWSSFPFVRLVAPFIVGVLLPRLIFVNLDSASFILIFSLLFLALLAVHYKVKSFSRRWISGVLITVTLIVLGYGYAFQKNKLVEPPQLQKRSQYNWVGSVDFIVEKEERIAQLEVLVKKLKVDSTWTDCNFRLMVYNQNHDLKIEIGDLVSGVGYLNKVPEPTNPSQFDYSLFLENKGMYYSTYDDNLRKKESSFSILKLASQLRKKVILSYETMGIQDEELAVLVALTLGDKSQLDNQLKEAYAGAGAMHILAVSGLHVGIVFLLFSQLLSMFPKNRFYQTVRALLLLLVIWFFALISGFSPSVQRAAWMFSFIIVSELVKRNSNIINSIAASAFLVILINPLVVFQLGFQLSYLAVLGIVLLYTPIYNFIYIKNKWIDKIWSLMVVSIAAQIATLPLTLYYFHQFPNYFLITNIFIIPIAFGVVFLAIALSVIYALFQTTFQLNYLLDFMLYCLNDIVQTISKIPYAISQAIWINTVSLLLLFLATISFTTFLTMKRGTYLVLSLIGFFLFSMSEFLDDLENRTNETITFYALKAPSISMVNGLEGNVFFDSSQVTAYDAKLIKNHLESMGVRSIVWSNINSDESFIESKFGLIGINVRKETLNELPEEIDYLIINKAQSLDSTIKINANNIIDYSFRNNNIDLEKLSFNFNYHNLRKEGALIINL